MSHYDRCIDDVAMGFTYPEHAVPLMRTVRPAPCVGDIPVAKIRRAVDSVSRGVCAPSAEFPECEQEDLRHWLKGIQENKRLYG